MTKRYVSLGVEVRIERSAGEGSNISDQAFEAAGAKITDSLESTLAAADLILRVRYLAVDGEESDELRLAKQNGCLVGMLAPHGRASAIEKYAQHPLTTFSLELMPRISRAQSMDVLSSQSNLAGYKAVIDAAAAAQSIMPMMMTSAGTIVPLKVTVLGAGVAGLQAIATAKRLGAVVKAFDIRAAAKEEVESLGATFIDIPETELQDDKAAGGYAREASEAYRQRQAEVLTETLAKQDIVICTALVMGRKAPTLLTKEMVEGMPHGSIIVDLAAEMGGNCELTKPDENIKVGGVTIMGYCNTASMLATDASQLYARNVFNFVSLMIDKESGSLKIDYDDEIIAGTNLTREGKIVHPMFTGGEK